MMGTINNRYRILQALGSGGCGQTFLVDGGLYKGL